MEDYEEYIKRLKDIGVNSLGSGSFGSVFEHPRFRNVVVKVVKDDPAYLKFAHLCLEKPHNRWLPKVAAVVPVKLKDVDGALIFLQKLNPAPERLVRMAMQEIAPDVDLSRFSVRCRLSLPEWERVAAEGKDPATKELATFLAANFAHLDLFTSNFRMLKNQIIFNDPLTPVK